MFANSASLCATSLLAFLLAAPSRHAQMKTPPKAASVAMPRVVPTMALDRAMSTLLLDDVDVAEAEDVVVVEVVENEDVLVPVDEDVADDEVDDKVLVDASEDVDVSEVDVEVAEDVAVVLSSALVVVLSARPTSTLRLPRACSDLRRSSPSRSASVLSPVFGPAWHFSVIQSAFSASSSVHPAASRHVARSSESTTSMAMQRVIIELSAHERSDTMFARHSLLISRGGAAVVGVARSRATAAPARFFLMLKELIVLLVYLM